MRTDSDTFMEAAEIKAATIRIEDGAIPFIMRKGKPVSLESFLRQPMRSRGTIRAHELEHVAEITRKLSAPNSNVACFWKWGRLTVYLNFHASPTEAGWCDFKITCLCRYRSAQEALSPHTVIKGKYSAR